MKLQTMSTRVLPRVQVSTRAASSPPRWETPVRYAAAYASTLIAIAGAQLVIPNGVALLFAICTLAGLPLSLWLRHTRLRPFGIALRRPYVNSFVVILSMVVTVLYMSLRLPSIFSPKFYQLVFVTAQASDSVGLLMEVFLIFAVCRSLAIVSDKDAVLCAVPSFSVLLLLIVVRREGPVVAYFLLWALVSAVLFALDHRSESRVRVSGYVPAVFPGQDIMLSARGLAAIMGFSLCCSIGISLTLSGRNPEERAAAEGWIVALAAKLTQFALNLPDVSVNNGPERQIDFSSSPSLPSYANLWRVGAMELEGVRPRPIQPRYWRMFTLAHYDGKTWSQEAGAGIQVPHETLTDENWPVRRLMRGGPFIVPPRLRRGTGRGGFGMGSAPTFYYRRSNDPVYDFLHRSPIGRTQANEFPGPRRRVLQMVTAAVANVGFVPTLPTINAMRLRDDKPAVVRVRDDISIDVGVTKAGQTLFLYSSIPPGSEYGGEPISPPERRDDKPYPQMRLSDGDRRMYLDLPAALPARVREMAARLSHSNDATEGDYRRAKRLELELQRIGRYTLHPPSIPTDHDAADYFLFESRRGYCTHFAGALTVLCRSIGIPARIVSGFTNLDWTPRMNATVIREANAHAWTEAWIPNWGWVTLDATPPDDRGSNAPSWWNTLTERLGLARESAARWSAHHREGVVFLYVGLYGLITLTLVNKIRHRVGGAGWRRRKLRNRRGWDEDTRVRHTIIDAYERAAGALSRRFRRRTPWETPDEWLGAALDVMQLREPRPLQELTQLYLLARYSPRPLQAALGLNACRALSDISWQRVEMESAAS